MSYVLGMLLVQCGAIPVWRDVLLFEIDDLRAVMGKWNTHFLRDIWLFRKMSHERNRRLVPVKHIGQGPELQSPKSAV